MTHWGRGHSTGKEKQKRRNLSDPCGGEEQNNTYRDGQQNDSLHMFGRCQRDVLFFHVSGVTAVMIVNRRRHCTTYTSKRIYFNWRRNRSDTLM